MTTAEAAQHLGVTEQHIRRLIRSGEISAKRRGRSWEIDAMSKDHGMSLHEELALARDAISEWRELAAERNTQNGRLSVAIQAMESDLRDARAEIARLQAIIAALRT